jgi:hypothetical protein
MDKKAWFQSSVPFPLDLPIPSYGSGSYGATIPFACSNYWSSAIQ